MSLKKRFSLKEKEKLKYLLEEGLSVSKISNATGIGTWRLLSELKRGMAKEEYVDRRYIKYNPMLALRREAEEAIGEDEYKLLVEYEIEQENGK